MGATDKHVAEIGAKLNSDCGQLSSWMHANSFKLNADKTHFLVMGTAERLNNMVEDLVVVMDGVRLEESKDKSAELLGVTVQCNLKWSLQVESLAKKLKTRLTGLEKLKYVMSSSNKKNIVQGVFNSVLCYCLPLFGGCSKTDVKLLQVLQNRAAQVVLRLPPRTGRALMFDKLDWLTVQQLIAYHTLIAVFRIRQTREPEDLATILSRENNTKHIIMKNTNLVLYRQSFMFRGAVLWNRLTLDLRKETTIMQFKRNLRGWIKENVSRFND